MDVCIERDVIRDLFRQVNCRGRQLWDHVSLSLALSFFLLPYSFLTLICNQIFILCFRLSSMKSIGDEVHFILH